MRPGRMPPVDETVRRDWPQVPETAEWAAVMTNVITGATQEVGVLWTVGDADDEMVGEMHSFVGDVPGFDAEQMVPKEDYWASVLTAKRAYDIIRIERQGKVVDYREKGAEFDAKLARVLDRRGGGDAK